MINKVRIPVVKSLVHYFQVYYYYTHKKIFLAVLFSVFVNVIEGVGFTLFIPLLQLNESKEKQHIVLELIQSFFHKFGAPLTMSNVLVAIVFVFLSKGVVKYIEFAYRANLFAEVVQKIRLRLLKIFSLAGYNYYLKGNSGHTNNILTLESKKMASGFSIYARVLSNLVSIGIFLIFSFFISREITLLGAIAGAIFIFVLRSVSKNSEKSSRELSQSNSALQNLLIQTLHTYKYLKATSGFKSLTGKTMLSVKDVAEKQKKITLAKALIECVSEPFIVIVLVGTIFVEVVYNENPLGPLIVALLLFNKVIKNMMSFQSSWIAFSSVRGSIDAVVKEIHMLETAKELCGDKLLNEWKSDIRLKDICFSYGNTPTLEKINLSIKKNSMVAFVGTSGAGKSTVVDLMAGILRPSFGEIYIDNIPYSQLNLYELRKKIGYVTQECFIYNDDVISNISLWENCIKSRDSVLQKVKEAATKAHCSSFIEKMPYGYSSSIGDRGITLSGGQRQRLALAREIYRKPDVLFLDEATSALDSESEQEVQRSIDSLKGKTTIVMIAHRISTIRNADRIYVMNQGRIIEEGTFQELTSSKGSVFLEMCKRQQVAL